MQLQLTDDHIAYLLAMAKANRAIFAKANKKERFPEMPVSVCIEDFCGRARVGNTSFSADYFPAEKLTFFTGDWDSKTPIPAMPSARKPTLERVWRWAWRHGSGWAAPRNRGF